ncbi:23S rRNA (uracil(1939)-C(5))-methyltransferase RlmD [Silvanigrella aquatica]|uniref:23S rRNA (Uracil-5-)-methyltransferase RumA n=1 Tax=Silvanigrella aquatica TaxID=1915309 RepID=A0A1L4D200_9BACT|nr:23S rRNA (uracil(1939)-C(5))-methyltransferase RlmD [Silvanigrella aquatica]APJ04222.1 23S rRNA (uracil-5-)-methyltransferase RumA [Silvanigrella aquatica]
MNDNYKQRSSSRPSRSSQSDNRSSPQSSKYRRDEQKNIEWKAKKPSAPNIRMMTSRLGVSERVMHEQPCRILEKCGSCPILDFPYKNQLLQKTTDFKSRLQKASAIFSNTIVKDCVESELRLAYRHNVKMVVSEHAGLKNAKFSQIANEKRWIDLGMYRQSSNEVVDTGRCPIQTNIMNDISAWLRTGIRVHNISVYTPQQKDGLLHCIILRSSHYTRQVLVTFVVTKPALQILRPLARDISEKFMNIQGVFMQVAPPNHSDDKQDPELKMIVGQDLLEEKYNDLFLNFSAASYMPVNSLVANRIYNRIEELAELTGKETVLDLYCGAGGISLTLARSAKEVLSIDSSVHCIKDAIRNAKRNEISNVGFYEGKVEEILPQLINEKRLQKADVVVVNPARQGCGPDVIEQIRKLEPKALFYLSSFFDPMFNDLKCFVDDGYSLVFFEPYDTLPGTNNYEVLCYLVKK